MDEGVAPEINRDIYGMPAFVTLAVTDLDRTIDWYVNGLDFVVLFTVPDPTGKPALVHLRRWRYQDILVRLGEASGGGEWTISMMATRQQLDGLAERARKHGGGVVHGPVDTPWNTRDLRVTDPDGYTVVYTARRAEHELDERFSVMMQEQVRAQLGP
ncbi:VOC family protein [Planotetraspora phitsanulokensis]|nr:VOC family protein [Planotetraspora phitsanulokensis]